MWVLRIVQILLGLVIMADSLRRNSFILKKIHRETPHRVDRILAFTGGLVLLIIGIWGELPRFW